MPHAYISSTHGKQHPTCQRQLTYKMCRLCSPALGGNSPCCRAQGLSLFNSYLSCFQVPEHSRHHQKLIALTLRMVAVPMGRLRLRDPTLRDALKSTLPTALCHTSGAVLMEKLLVCIERNSFESYLERQENLSIFTDS